MPEAEPQGSQSPAPWILTGVGGAALAAGIVVFVVGASDVSEANKDCPNHQCPPGLIGAATSKQNDGYTLENAGAVVGGVGAAAALAGIIWGLVRAGAVVPTVGANVSPVVSNGYGGVAVGGRF